MYRWKNPFNLLPKTRLFASPLCTDLSNPTLQRQPLYRTTTMQLSITFLALSLMAAYATAQDTVGDPNAYVLLDIFHFRYQLTRSLPPVRVHPLIPPLHLRSRFLRFSIAPPPQSRASCLSCLLCSRLPCLRCRPLLRHQCRAQQA